MVTRISVNGTSFNVDETLPHPFWSGVNDGRWEPDTFRLFDRVLMPNWRSAQPRFTPPARSPPSMPMNATPSPSATCAATSASTPTSPPA